MFSWSRFYRRYHSWRQFYDTPKQQFCFQFQVQKRGEIAPNRAGYSQHCLGVSLRAGSRTRDESAQFLTAPKLLPYSNPVNFRNFRTFFSDIKVRTNKVSYICWLVNERFISYMAYLYITMFVIREFQFWYALQDKQKTECWKNQMLRAGIEPTTHRSYDRTVEWVE